jgi:hypothetical protein
MGAGVKDDVRVWSLYFRAFTDMAVSAVTLVQFFITSNVKKAKIHTLYLMEIHKLSACVALSLDAVSSSRGDGFR